jgi:hypothetical protein
MVWDSRQSLTAYFMPCEFVDLAQLLFLITSWGLFTHQHFSRQDSVFIAQKLRDKHSNTNT